MIWSDIAEEFSVNGGGLGYGRDHQDVYFMGVVP